MQRKAYACGRDRLLGQKLQMYDVDMSIQMEAPSTPPPPRCLEPAQRGGGGLSGAKLTRSMLDHMLQMVSQYLHHKMLQSGITPTLRSEPRNQNVIECVLNQ